MRYLGLLVIVLLPVHILSMTSSNDEVKRAHASDGKKETKKAATFSDQGDQDEQKKAIALKNTEVMTEWYQAIRACDVKNSERCINELGCLNHAYFWKNCLISETEKKSPVWVALNCALQAREEKKSDNYEKSKTILKHVLSRGEIIGLEAPTTGELKKGPRGRFIPGHRYAVYRERDYEWVPLRKNVDGQSICNSVFCCISWLWCGLTENSGYCGYAWQDAKGGLQHLVSRANNVELLQILKAHDFDLEEPDERGWPPIVYAAKAGAKDAFIYLHDTCKISWDYCPNCTSMLCLATPDIRKEMKAHVKDDCCASTLCCMSCI